MNEELKAIIKDLYQVEKNPETILTVLKDEGHELTIAQVNEVLGVKKPSPIKINKLKGDVILPKEIKESAIGAMNEAVGKTTDIDKAIQEAADAIQEAQYKVNFVWGLKKNAGQEAGRYVRAADQLRKLKNTVQG